ncbi:hypothetical protein MishRS11D_04300 [Methylomagnum ishizawai]|nr:hypothetical protein MishRS11D_04300 [Methylomagnum ishizawai]
MALRLPRLNGDLFPLLLLLSVYGFALSLLLGRGSYKPCLYLCGYATLGILASTRPPRLDRDILAVVGLGALLLGQGLAMAGDKLWGSAHTALFGATLLVFALRLLPDRLAQGRPPPHAAIAASLLLVAVLAHAIAYPLKLNQAGLYSNLHYLALFSVTTLPLLFYFAATIQNRLRWLCILALAVDFWLLLKTQSRPGYLALLASALASLPFLSRRCQSLALGSILLLPLGLYFSGLFGFAARVDDLAANFLKEERMIIWRETWAMQLRSPPLEWAFGHGFGAYFWNYQPISSYHDKEDFTFPHNYFLEVLYSHGLLGLTLVVLAYASFFWKLAITTWRCQDQTGTRFGIMLISVASAELVQSFLTLPLFSRHQLYPFGLLLGASLYYFRKYTPHERH